jgi:hypothetical protein
MVKFIKRVMLKQCETKHTTQSTENNHLFHNVLDLPFTSLLQVAQGDDEYQRTDDEE